MISLAPLSCYEIWDNFMDNAYRTWISLGTLNFAHTLLDSWSCRSNWALGIQGTSSHANIHRLDHPKCTKMALQSHLPSDVFLFLSLSWGILKIWSKAHKTFLFYWLEKVPKFRLLWTWSCPWMLRWWAGHTKLMTIVLGFHYPLFQHAS